MSVTQEIAENGRISRELDRRGYAYTGELLDPPDIDALSALYVDDNAFRSRIIMERHGFGAGEYKYFDYPLPPRIATLRSNMYSQLTPIANRWQEQLNSQTRFPAEHCEMLARCHAAGQTRPTPLMLKYGQGDFNCLHQDLCGEHAFPLQIVILLSDEDSFEGGEFVLTEQRPRMQTRVEVVRLRKGHGVAFAVNERPKQGRRGFYRVKMRHGVSEIRSGTRLTLGIIFHDAA